ncbi:MAG TPA: NPCBM/NEW2 domain-containing protein [Polyangiaceae bacterium]
MSSRSSSPSAPPFQAVLLAALAFFGCGREDVELAPPPTATEVPDDCSAKLPEGLVGARPPMGWNGYNAFECSPELDETKLRENVDALVASGMQSAGYHYVNLDACWQVARNAEGQRVFDPVRFPGGIDAFSSDVHALGLSLGVFATAEDCRGEPGGEGYETIDAESYVAWGVDYVKYATCEASGISEGAARALAEALAETERPMVLSLAAPPFREWMPDTVHLWRTSENAEPTWSSMVNAIDTAVPLAAYARPGGFNDPDMLEIGNGALTPSEMRVQFSTWSILSAPLLAGNDLSTMTEETRAVLTNDRLIAVNQDPLALQAALVHRDGDIDVLAKPLAGCGARAAVLWNRGETSAEVSLTWNELWLEPGEVTVRDLWSDTPLESGSDGVTLTVASHDAVALSVTGVEPPSPRARVYLSDLHFTYATNGFGPVELDRTNGEDAALDGNPIRLRGAAYDKGLGVHGPSLLRYRLGQRCSRFAADVGVDDDQAGMGSVQFEVWADGERLFQSGVLTGTSPTRGLSIDVRGRRELRLFVGTGGDTDAHDHAVWAGARLECDP